MFVVYFELLGYLGGLIGCWVNWIVGVWFMFDGIDYVFDCNEGGNLFYGGVSGFYWVLWDVEDYDGVLVMWFIFLEGDVGFFGNVVVQVCYVFDDDGMLLIDYEVWIDVFMLINLISYGYFNLSGKFGIDIKGYILLIDVDVFLEVDVKLILI